MKSPKSTPSTSSEKIRIAVLYGGRSGEHEISLLSAASVLRNLDRNRFEIIPVAIDKDGKWHLNDLKMIEAGAKSLPVFKNQPEVVLPAGSSSSGVGALVPLKGERERPFDVVFPVMHGTYCEDGSIQGLLELADVAYVGCGVLASAVGMDKDVAKRLIRDAGLPVVPYVAVKAHEWEANPKSISQRIQMELNYPVFVKPANLGSSVGVHKVREAAALAGALQDAFRYDVKVLVEKAVSAREIEVSVLENPVPGGEPLVSVPGEISATHEFYSYEAKYLDEHGASLSIPAKLAPEQTARAQKIARDAFLALECEGMARVDLFLDKVSGDFYFNEVNTIPGFTSISMYPKMWEASGIPYGELLTRLVELALARHQRKRVLVRDFHST